MNTTTESENPSLTDAESPVDSAEHKAMPNDAEVSPGWAGVFHRVENGLIVFVFAMAIVLPLIQALDRVWPFGGPGQLRFDGHAEYMKQAMLWLSFLGGLIATRPQKHLRLSTGEFLAESRWGAPLHIFAMSVSICICLLLAEGSTVVVWEQFQQAEKDGRTGLLPFGIPNWVSEGIFPLALVLIALRFVWQSSPDVWGRALTAAIGIGLTFVLNHPGLVEEHLYPLAGLVLAATILGAPIFAAMGGLAYLLLLADASFTPPEVEFYLFLEEDQAIAASFAVSLEVYDLVSKANIRAIPLLTVCGVVLAESRAAERLVQFFKALVGWMPGGVAVLVAAVCALFTALTGGSAVTIVALGGLTYGVLREGGYPEDFRLGHITSSSSLGLLFFPSIPVIYYSFIVSRGGDPALAVNLKDLFIAGFLPGVLMLALVGGYGVWVGRKLDVERPSFDFERLFQSAWTAKWELSIPVLILVLFFSGWMSMEEAAAFAAAYTIMVEVFITREINLTKDLPRVLVKSGILVGAILILMASSLALSSYCAMEGNLPEVLLAWSKEHIDSKLMFLLCLNVLLLVLGCVLEIFSALVILPPILAPIAIQYGVDPVHLGIIFLANLELGFLTPPVGLNLFFSAIRFDQPVTRLYRVIIPYLVIMLVCVLIITYVPALSIGFLEWFK